MKASEAVQEDTKEEKKWCVYCHTSPSGKKYIGITGEENPVNRWGLSGNGYLKLKPNGEFQQPKIANAILKYSNWDEWIHEILFSDLTQKEAEDKEMELIEKYNTRDSVCGYNIRSGGGVLTGTDHPMFGKRHSEEAKKRMSEARIAKGLGIGSLNPNYGKSPQEWMSEESYERWKKEIGEVAKRNWENDEYRQRRHESLKRYWDNNPERKEEFSKRNSGENNYCYGKTPQELMGFDEEKIKQWKENISKSISGENNFWYGKHLPEETRQKISKTRIEQEVAKGKNNPMHGKHHSDETKDKISKALTGKYSGSNNKKNKAIFCIELNKIFYSAVYAKNATGISSKNIGCCCRHYKGFNTAGGYSWCFCDDYTTKEGVVIPGAISMGYITQQQLDDYLNDLKGD